MSDHFIHLREGGLQIFFKEREEDVLLYAPGYLVRIEKLNWQTHLLGSDELQALETHSRRTIKQPVNWTEPFAPVSINVYLTRYCNLACSYCFSDPAHANHKLMTPTTDAILKGAQIVIENCKRQNLPMTFVLHGGGEPTLDKRVEPLASYVRDLCGNYDLRHLIYLATNGIMPFDKAAKLCSYFDLIGLSCDGYPDIQDAQRPMVGAGKSSQIIERTARAFHDQGQDFQVRLTLTEESWPHMPEIASYMIEYLHPNGINVELVYRTGRFPVREEEFTRFIEKFLSAKERCLKANITWQRSAIRPNHHHRQYCHILQQTLQIIPGDVASMCFLDNDSDECAHHETQIGIFDKVAKKWVFDDDGIALKRAIILEEKEICEKCFVSSHCHRSCPDICPLNRQGWLPDLYCKLNRDLFNACLERTGNQLVTACKHDRTPIMGQEIDAC